MVQAQLVDDAALAATIFFTLEHLFRVVGRQSGFRRQFSAIRRLVETPGSATVEIAKVAIIPVFPVIDEGTGIEVGIEQALHAETSLRRQPLHRSSTRYVVRSMFLIARRARLIVAPSFLQLPT